MKSLKKVRNGKEKVIFHQNNASCHKSLRTGAKLYELGFELLSHPSYSPDLSVSAYWPFADLKRQPSRSRKAEKIFHDGMKKLVTGGRNVLRMTILKIKYAILKLKKWTKKVKLKKKNKYYKQIENFFC